MCPQLSTRFLTNIRKIVDMMYPNMQSDVKLKLVQEVIDSELKNFVDSHKAELEVYDKINDMRAQASHATVSRTTSLSSSSEHQNNVDAISITQSSPTPEHEEAAYALLSLH